MDQEREDSRTRVLRILENALGREARVVEPFGEVTPWGFNDWKAIIRYDAAVDEVTKVVQTDYEFESPESANVAGGFRTIEANLERIILRLIELQLGFVEREPGEYEACDWDELYLSFTLRDRPLTNETKWTGQAEGGPVAGSWNLFLSGSTLDAILPVWDDPGGYDLDCYYD